MPPWWPTMCAPRPSGRITVSGGASSAGGWELFEGGVRVPTAQPFPQAITVHVLSAGTLSDILLSVRRVR